MYQWLNKKKESLFINVCLFFPFFYSISWQKVITVGNMSPLSITTLTFILQQSFCYQALSHRYVTDPGCITTTPPVHLALIPTGHTNRNWYHYISSLLQTVDWKRIFSIQEIRSYCSRSIKKKSTCMYMHSKYLRSAKQGRLKSDILHV